MSTVSTVVVIGVDFDGVVCEEQWPGIGAVDVDMVEALIEARRKGYKLILWTCRTQGLLALAVRACCDNGLEFDAVNANLPERIKEYGDDSRKVGIDMLLDDRAWGYDRAGVVAWLRRLPER